MDSWLWTPSSPPMEPLPSVTHGLCIEWWNGPQVECATVNGVAHLACAVDDQHDIFEMRWLLAPCNDDVIKEICGGKMPLRDGFLKVTSTHGSVHRDLRHAEVLLLDLAYTGEVLRAWKILSLDVPDAYLPTAGACLAPRTLPIFPDDVENAVE
jgi:hypothetical protein